MAGRITNFLSNLCLWVIVLLFVWFTATYSTIIPLWVSLPLLSYLVAGLVFRKAIAGLYADWCKADQQ